jgi:hypothetical protein
MVRKDFDGRRARQVVYDPERRELFVYDTGGTARRLQLLQDESELMAEPFQVIPFLSGEGSAKLAPGGRLAARLHPAPQGLSTVELYDLTNGKKTGTLREGQEPARVRFVALGYQGNLILAYLPLDSISGATGRWRWTFWSRKGELLGEFTSQGLLSFWLGPEGRVVGFRTPAAYVVRDAQGEVVKRVGGTFASSALSANGSTLLLTDLDQRSNIQIVSDRGNHRIDTGGAVYGLRLSSSGKRGLVWFQGGRFRELDPATGELGAEFKSASQPDAWVNSVRIEDSGRATIVLVVRSLEGGKRDTGWVMQAENGQVQWQLPYPVREVTARIPSVLWVGEQEVLVRDYENFALVRPPESG